MDVTGLLSDSFERVNEGVHQVLEGIDEAHLTFRPDPEANTVAWLVWHLARVQDDHIAEVAGTDQRWTADGWFQLFGLPFEPSAIGYGQSPAEVGDVTAGAELLRGYFDAVHLVTRKYLAGLSAADLDRVVDDRWDPPVTLSVRLVSVVSDDLQHVGQAAYVRGVAERGR